jgi:hypothetical protein
MVLVSVVILGLALWGAMLWLTYGDDKPDALLIHLGETGATLAVLTVLGGLVRAAFMQRDKTRQKQDARHAFYRSLLADLKSVYDRVESCRLLVEAHRSAKTYGEQVRALVDGVVTLHNMKRALDPEFPKLKEELAKPINEMTTFIKELLKEFRDEYRKISQLQEADEAWNKYSREILPKENKAPEEYKPLSRAWAAMQKLPKLAVLRDDDKFNEYETKFLRYLDDASRTLRSRLPIDE